VSRLSNGVRGSRTLDRCRSCNRHRQESLGKAHRGGKAMPVLEEMM